MAKKRAPPPVSHTRTTTHTHAHSHANNRRSQNLDARKQSKIQKKKDKRDKKLLRAGFEGRKAGFIKPGGK